MKKLFTVMALLMMSITGFAENYLVVGASVVCNGQNWNNNADVNLMTTTDNATYTLAIAGLTLEAGSTYEYKIVEKGSWNEYYPNLGGPNANFTVAETGVYDIEYVYTVASKSCVVNTTKKGDAGEITHVYSIAGNNTDLFGANWSATETSTEMTLNGEVYEWTKEDITLSAGNIEFKVVQDHSWDIAYPASNYILKIDADGKYDVAITFNANSKAVNATATKKEDVVIEHVYSIIGELTGGWETDMDMTKQSDDVYTLTVEGFEAEAKAYEYKLRTDHEWNVYEIPGDGTNQSYTFEKAGTYDLTFTANVKENTLELVAELKEEVELNEYSVTFVNGKNWDKVYAYVWTMVDDNAVTLADWPGTELEKTGTTEIENVTYDVYTYAFKAEAAPENIIFNNGEGEQTADLAYEDGKQYTETVEPVLEKQYFAYFVNMPGWSNVKVYAWAGDKVLTAAWPGDAVEEAGEFEVAAYEGTYTKYEAGFVEEPEYIIFNGEVDGNLVQTADITYSATAPFAYDGYTGNTSVLFNDAEDQYQPAEEYALSGLVATYARKFVPGTKQTVVLPFYLTGEMAENAGKFYTPESVADGKIKFNRADEVQPYTPYLFIANSEFPFQNLDVVSLDPSPAYDGSFVENWLTVGEGATFKFGSQHEELYSDEEVTYYGFENDVFKKAATANINPWRAYFQIATSDNLAAELIIDLGDETAIPGIATQADNETEVIYNLQGQKVASTTAKGIYIVNGKKMLVK